MSVFLKCCAGSYVSLSDVFYFLSVLFAQIYKIKINSRAYGYAIKPNLQGYEHLDLCCADNLKLTGKLIFILICSLAINILLNSRAKNVPRLLMLVLTRRFTINARFLPAYRYVSSGTFTPQISYIKARQCDPS
jgi:hypothetical protein